MPPRAPRVCLAGAAGAVLLALASCSACARSRSPVPRYDHPPVVLISIDTLRSDRLPVYGYDRGITPAIDALARDSIVFERAYSHYPLTLPSHASIFTGLLPPHHGVRDNIGYLFDASRHPTLAQRFRSGGYDTAGMVSAFVLRRETGIAAGFDEYDDRLPAAAREDGAEVERRGSDTTRRAIDWVASRGAEPFFLFLHLYEPHAPHQAAEPFASRLADPYDAEVSQADADVGALLGELRERGIYDRAIVVLLSDHGEGLGDHGEQTHGVFLYREVLQVPLLVKLPDNEYAGTRVDGIARLIDVFPTLVELCGLEPLRSDGSSLLELMRPGAADREVYSETFYPRLHLGWSDLASMIAGDFHYIAAPRPELYNLHRDPAELRNVIEHERRPGVQLRQALAEIDRSLAPAGEVDAETRRRLAGLGYLTQPASGVHRGVLPDPKDQLAVVQQMEASFHAFDRGELEHAVAGFRALLESNPLMTDIWSNLGLALQRLGRHREAVVAFEKSLTLSGTPAFAQPLAWSLIALGRLDDAQAQAEIVRQSAPPDSDNLLMQIAVLRHDLGGARRLMHEVAARGTADEELRRRFAMALLDQGLAHEALRELQGFHDSADSATQATIATALTQSGQPELARQRLDLFVARHPENARAHAMVGLIAMQAGQPVRAEAALRRALALEGGMATAWNTLGILLYQERRPAEALSAWRRAVELDATQVEALFNIGLVAHESGRTDESRQALRRFLEEAPGERYATELSQARQLLAGQV